MKHANRAREKRTMLALPEPPPPPRASLLAARSPRSQLNLLGRSASSLEIDGQVATAIPRHHHDQQP